MTPETIIHLGQTALWNLTLLLMLLLIPALIVGVLVSMFQAATQINEMTLSFIPKLLVTLFVMAVAAPWMITMMTDFTVKLFMDIPSLIH